MAIVGAVNKTAAPRIVTRMNGGDAPVLYLADNPIIAGGRSGHYIFERHQTPPGHMPPHVFEDHMFMLPMSSFPVRFYSRLNGRQVNGQFEPGRFRFLAAGDSLSTAWNQSMDSILVSVHPNVLRNALGDDLFNGSLELTSNILPHDDPVLTNLTLVLQAHIESGCLEGKLFEQSVVTALAVHLLYAYCRGGKPSKSSCAPLIRWKLARIEEYVRQNLGRSDLNLGEIAAAVNLSACHLSRAFRATTGQGLWRFVLECRARQALRMMTQKHAPPLAQIARLCGFESYSQFITAFRKFYGHLPSEYQRTCDK